ncbi:MAG: hypothetical protein WDM84_01235 [Bauldia sp.]
MKIHTWPQQNTTWLNWKNADTDLKSLLKRLVDYTFIDSITLSAEVSNNESLAPSVGFIHPYSATGSLGSLLSVGGSMTGAQDHTETVNFAVDFADLKRHPETCPADTTLAGDLGLIDDVVSGLLALNRSSTVNISRSATALAVPSTTLEFPEQTFAVGADVTSGKTPIPPTIKKCHFERIFRRSAGAGSVAALTVNATVLEDGKPSYAMSGSAATEVLPTDKLGMHIRFYLDAKATGSSPSLTKLSDSPTLTGIPVAGILDLYAQPQAGTPFHVAFENVIASVDVASVDGRPAVTEKFPLMWSGAGSEIAKVVPDLPGNDLFASQVVGTSSLNPPSTTGAAKISAGARRRLGRGLSSVFPRPFSLDTA